MFHLVLFYISYSTFVFNFYSPFLYRLLCFTVIIICSVSPGGVPGVHGCAKLRLLVRNLAHLTHVVVEVVFSIIGKPQVKQLKSVDIIPDDILEAGEPSKIKKSIKVT